MADSHIIQGVNLAQVPANVPVKKLYCWTKFCVGERIGGFRYGAVKPPGEEYTWMPAAISSNTIRIASTRTFNTAEEAANWLRSVGMFT